jgi:hypothetical protein
VIAPVEDYAVGLDEPDMGLMPGPRPSWPGQVLSELARRGLAASAARAGDRPGLRHGVPVLAARGETVTIEDVLRLQDHEGM